MPSFAAFELLCDFISNFETRPDDVFVVGFPKSGTTWMQEIVWQIFNDGVVHSETNFQRVPFLELASNPRIPQPDIKTMPSPRILKTHLPYDVIPKGANEDTLRS
ncbi:Sulfotransferase, cytosolic, 1B, member [Desmophyllum pertusum]|uniref:Sulfotransferase, cytosolic, 1B, member n=1 Tax=Desmophyllum pertusum TaxID=174260 RepID=A0A9X0CT27_9CNID|nr:Sulfotransferase, cytosolic, 1B, member [Desmophyllum pertusum]